MRCHLALNINLRGQAVSVKFWILYPDAALVLTFVLADIGGLLDYALSDFLEEQYEGLEEGEKRLFVQLLDYEDQLLLDWVMGNVVPSDPAIRQMVDKICKRA